MALTFLLPTFSACGEAQSPHRNDGDSQGSLEIAAEDEDLATNCGNTRLAPPPREILNDVAVPIDFISLDVDVTFDASAKIAHVGARVIFQVGPTGGWPILDVRQSIEGAWLDGAAIEPERVVRSDFAQTDSGGVLVVESVVASCSTHELVFSYSLANPGPSPDGLFLPDWHSGGVRWNSGLAELAPGMFLERWFPAPLPHDTFTMKLTVRVTNSGSRHRMLANAPITNLAENSWAVDYPADTDSMTPLFYLAPEEELTILEPSSPGLVLAYTTEGLGRSDPEKVRDAARDILTEFEKTYGARGMDVNPYLLVLDDLEPPASGMEYRNGAIVGKLTPVVLRHELLHAWFGRSLRPARNIDAWIDEAFVTWATDPQAGDLDPASDIAVPVASGDPWLRQTFYSAYNTGAAIFQTLADRFGGGAISAVMADLAQRCEGQHITHHDLRLALHALPDPSFVDALFAAWVVAPSDFSDVRGTCDALAR